jgi:hypothetical protein
MRTLAMLVSSLALVVLIAGPARAAGGFSPVPALQGKAKTTLQVRQVGFSGGASGQITVEVKNDGQQPQTFQARGLYFVPNGNAENAPQRVGAVGPFEVKESQKWIRREQLLIQPGQTVRLKLDTFCLDSHRGSPGKAQGFGVAKERLPEQLMKANESAAKDALKASAGNPGAAKSAIQSKVWENRNKKWIKLEGERANEKGSDSTRRQRRLPRQNQIAE